MVRRLPNLEEPQAGSCELSVRCGTYVSYAGDHSSAQSRQVIRVKPRPSRSLSGMVMAAVADRYRQISELTAEPAHTTISLQA